MPLASQKRVEGVTDSVAIRSRFGADFGASMPCRCLVDARGDTKDKAQRRQNVAKNRLDFIVWRVDGCPRRHERHKKSPNT